LVQLAKAWRQRRLAGSNISARQSRQTAVSWPIIVAARPLRLSMMTKPSPARAGAASRATTELIRASGGASCCRRSTSDLTCSAAPRTSISTPRESLRTQPARPSSLASRQTKGRKPTP
jgi:hypothetical protein